MPGVRRMRPSLAAREWGLRVVVKVAVMRVGRGGAQVRQPRHEERQMARQAVRGSQDHHPVARRQRTQ